MFSGCNRLARPTFAGAVGWARMIISSALGDLFRQRWHAELDIRSIKTTMRMEMLRTKTPDMVRKEVGMHLLAYNLIRGIMAEAARGRDIQPRELRAELQWGAADGPCL